MAKQFSERIVHGRYNTRDITVLLPKQFDNVRTLTHRILESQLMINILNKRPSVESVVSEMAFEAVRVDDYLFNEGTPISIDFSQSLGMMIHGEIAKRLGYRVQEGEEKNTDMPII